MEVLVADRSERGKLRFTDEQRAWFLHQVMTQAFEDIAPGEARETAMLTAKGRMRGYLEVVATEDALLAHFEPELRATLPDEIRRYVFATRVVVEDVTDTMGLVLVAGEEWRERVAEAGVDGIVQPTKGLGAPAGYVWVPPGEAAAAVEALVEAGGAPASEERLEAVRIAHGVARWGRDMDFKTIPQEAGIDAVAVHYDKGCYTGQEAMAKIHLRGKVNRHLRRIVPESAVEPGAEVAQGGAKVGVVTSAADGRALALLKFTVEPGQRVEAGGVPAVVEG
jgi:folate-binding protein YgfZ